MQCGAHGIVLSAGAACQSPARSSAAVICISAAVLALALPSLASGATRQVADTGVDGPDCGLDAATACRSITQAIALAAPGDTIIVGPGRYGDLNRNGVLGDIPGEEIGSPGCSCVLSMNKAVIIISSRGAAVTIIDGTSVNVVQTVVVLSVGGEFGRPGKGFTVTETGRFSQGVFTGHGIGIDAADVKVRGNQVIFSRADSASSRGMGIFTVNIAAIRIEGNQVTNWGEAFTPASGGIHIRVAGAAIVSKNQLIGNGVGIVAQGGTVVGNVATGNHAGFHVFQDTTVSGNAAFRNFFGFAVDASFTGVLTKNNMFGNSGCGLANSEVIGLEAANNYWGAATGPGDPPADQLCDFGVGSTTTSPFATKPFNVQILKP